MRTHGELPGDFKIDWDSPIEDVFKLEDLPPFITGFDSPISNSVEQEFTFNGYVNEDLFKALTCAPLSSSFSMTCKSPKSVQIRRHKKKRINKKWAKRYGYKMVFDSFKLNEVSLVPEGSTIEFIAGSMEMR